MCRIYLVANLLKLWNTSFDACVHTPLSLLGSCATVVVHHYAASSKLQTVFLYGNLLAIHSPSKKQADATDPGLASVDRGQSLVVGTKASWTRVHVSNVLGMTQGLWNREHAYLLGACRLEPRCRWACEITNFLSSFLFASPIVRSREKVASECSENVSISSPVPSHTFGYEVFAALRQSSQARTFGNDDKRFILSEGV
jgi:hypothetical protein